MIEVRIVVTRRLNKLEHAHVTLVARELADTLRIDQVAVIDSESSVSSRVPETAR